MNLKLAKTFKPPTEDECWDRLMAIKDVKEAIKKSFGNTEFLRQVFPLADLPTFDHEIEIAEDSASRNDYEEVQYQLQKIIFEDFNAFLLALQHHIVFPYQFEEIYAIINDLCGQEEILLEGCVFNENLGLYEVFSPDGDIWGTMPQTEFDHRKKQKHDYERILGHIIENADRFNVDI